MSILISVSCKCFLKIINMSSKCIKDKILITD